MMQQQSQSLDEAFDATIDALLIERHTLLMQFVDLPQMSVTDGVLEAVHGLREVIVDYSSRGHFNVYEQLLQHIKSNNVGEQDKAQMLLAKIHDTTDKIVLFDDEYGSVMELTVQDVGHFSDRLPQLGEVLTERFNHDDELMSLMHATLV